MAIDNAVNHNQLQSYLARTKAGQPTPDPLLYTPKNYRILLKRAGLALTRAGRIVAKPGAPKREAVKR